MDIIINYLLIGWIFGFANFIIGLNESNSYDQHYVIAYTLVVVLYWPVVVVTNIISFVNMVKEKIKNKKNKWTTHKIKACEISCFFNGKNTANNNGFDYVDLGLPSGTL